MRKSRQPKAASSPAPVKSPKAAVEPQYDGASPLWSLQLMDGDGQWSVRTADSGYFRKALRRLANLETMTWNAILGDRHNNHYVSPDTLCPEAQARLSELQLDGTDNLVSLRIEGRPRIWGIRDRGVFRVIWWDPEHTVCPSHKKHT